ncbi:MAG: cytochrome c biogenesis protein CcsA [Vicinamibacteria bacterium]|jgi:heme exporter protein C|nr:cytochrome c biogenesis protein CcsA [Vicinamibacteria bacterium]
MMRSRFLPYFCALTGASLLMAGSWIGLHHTPAERFQGEVQRIMYIHVPAAQIAMLALFGAFIAAIVYLMRGRAGADAYHEACVEAGVMLGVLLCIQGSIWAKPTWGVWWDWDPRLTTTAVMVLSFSGVLTLRAFVEDAERRAVWSAVATIVAFANVPLTYFSVRLWDSLHQLQSPPSAISPLFALPLRLNLLGLALLMAGVIVLRAEVARLRRTRERGGLHEHESARGGQP